MSIGIEYLKRMLMSQEGAKENEVSSVVGDSFIQLMRKYFVEIIQTNEELKALQEYPLNNKHKLFHKGIWYAENYFAFLKSCGGDDASDRLADFVGRDVFHGGMASPEYFDQLAHPEIPTVHVMHFQVKDSVVPSEALASLGEHLSLLDCLTTCQIAAYRALKDLLGEEKFNHLFRFGSGCCLTLSSQSPLLRFFEKVFIKSEAEIIPGDICYINSIHTYLTKHPLGNAQGFNLLCMDNREEPLYLGFGLPSHGVGKGFVEAHLCKKFNEDPIENEMGTQEMWMKRVIFLLFRHMGLGRRRAPFHLVHDLAHTRLTMQEFNDAPSWEQLDKRPTIGKLSCLVLRPNLEAINALVRAPLENVREVFMSINPKELIAMPEMCLVQALVTL